MKPYEDPFGPEAHDNNFGPIAWPRGQLKPHSGNCGHYCNDWDGLWICEDCDEFHCCTCAEKTPEQKERAIKYYAELEEYNKKNPIEI